MTTRPSHVTTGPSFGTLLRGYRTRAGLTQEALAERSGLSVRGISDLERGLKRAPRRDTVTLLLEALDLSPEERAALVAAARTPPAETVPGYGVRLPLSPAPLIGREREAIGIVDLLGGDGVRLLTLLGPGGVGKTRLALAVAHQLVDQFPDGVIFADLTPVRDPALVLSTVASALGVRDTGTRALAEVLAVSIGTRHLLLVLDNCEQVVQAAPEIAALLAACPALTILATSRVVLRVAAEQVVPVLPLELPDRSASTSLSELEGSEAIVLFVARAHAADPAFGLTEANAGATAELVHRLDGLPLAIELAAARIRTLPPEAMLARLDRRLPLLTGGARDAPARQRTMRDAIAWSHDLLSNEVQALLRQLAVFVGGFTVDAAEAIMRATDQQDVDVLEGLSMLVDSSLLHKLEGIGDEPRFGMLETIREYALERLAESEDEATTRARHADYNRRLAESALPHYDGPEARVYQDRVEFELNNCRAALSWALEARDGETGIRLAGALWRVWWYGQAAGGRPWAARVAEGLAWIDRTLSMNDGLPVEALTEALTGATSLSMLLGDPDRGQAFAEDLLARARAEGYAYGEFWALMQLGTIAMQDGRFDDARARFAACLRIVPSVRNRENHAALAHFNLGMVVRLTKDLDSAARHLDEALRFSREAGNGSLTAKIACELGCVSVDQGDPGRAAALLSESVVAYMGQRNMSGMHTSLSNLALVALKTEQVARGARLLGAAAGLPSHAAAIPGWYRDDAATSHRAATTARKALGDAAFAVAWETGRALAWDAMLVEIDALIAEIDNVPAASDRNRALRHGLSRRELQILQLLVDGRSNRAIADMLSLSERTIENHVLHILTKLGLESRTAAATYAVRQGLA